ncbi:hypothetical protein NG99_00630 [Erwinia typographi]|uniref:DUF1360 domain-containing protein n=1 Tax=Erwinia typographi TaxID=371042 RepID=A0A0A4ADW9_9GAMM|nr:hypothetical protein [Erwinia typographi]KGT96048.1 hypothetical protein NG99_00630 [Erwinia typographi]
MSFDTVLEPFWICLVIALTSSCISITVTQQEMFRPWREWVVKRNAMIGYLFSCFYCFSHWVVFAGIAIYKPVLVHSGFWLVDLAVTAFFTIGLTAMFSGIILKVMRNAIAKAIEENDMKNKLGL